MSMFKKLVGVSLSAVLAASLISGAAVVSAQGDETEPIAPAATAETQDEMSAYLFVHFVGNESNADMEQIYFSVSKDGTNWRTLNGKQPVMRSNVGERGVRDPNIIRKPDGSGYYVIATDLSIFNINGDWGGSQTNGSRNIVVWESEDLVTWSEPWLAEIARDNATCTWAPEVIWDAEREAYMVYWASKTKEDWYHRVYRSYTKDFHEFTTPEVYIEAEESRIDTTFIKEGDTYYRFTKDEHNTYVYMEKSTSLSGDFTAVSTYRINGQSHKNYGGYEGPTIFKLKDGGGWCLLLDNYGNSAGYKPFVTDDISKGEFYSATRGFDFDGVTFRHGTVMPITEDELNALLGKWGQGVTFPAEQKPEANKPEPDKTTGELIYELDFDTEAPVAKTGSYTATANGTITYTDGKDGGKAAVISGNNNFITLDGSMLAGKECLTVSFDVNVADASANYWVYFAAPNDSSTGNNPTYIGGLFKKDSGGIIACERFLNGRADDSYSRMDPAKWVNVTVVYGRTTTKVFIDGVLTNDSANRGTTNTSFRLTDILGATPVFYLGKATWSGGEYSKMTLDGFRVYDYAMPDAEVAELIK